jgi:formimidoylglutamate deiminase
MTGLFELEHVLSPAGWLSPGWLRLDEEGRVAELSATPSIASPAELERVRGFVLPGMPNLHSHAFQRAMVGLAERASGGADSFWTWREQMYRLVDRLGPEDVEAVSAQAYAEMLEAGYTSVAEFHYLHHDKDGSPYADRAELSLRVAAAAERAGIGLTLLPALYSASGFGGAPPARGQRRFAHDADGFVRLVGDLRKRASPRVGVALHSLRAVPPEALAACLGGLDGVTPVHVHVAEQRKEVNDCLAWSGARPVEWLLEHAPVGPAWCAVHATHMNDRELAALAASGAVAGLCPTTEANLGDGIFQLRKWLDAGGRFGVGSDSQVGLDPAEELCLLEYQARLAAEARNVLASASEPSTGARLFGAALCGGAQALGSPAAGLAPGAPGDLVVLDADHPLVFGRAAESVLDAFVFARRKALVRHVMAGGRWVVRDGRHVRAEAITTAFRDAMTRLGAD